MKIRVVVAHNIDLALIGAQVVLNQESQFQVVAALNSLERLLVAITDHCPDIIVVSERLDPDLDVLQLMAQVQSAAPFARLIVVGCLKDGLLVRDLFQFGIQSYLYEGDELQDYLRTAVRVVMRDRPYLSPTANAEYLVAMQSPQRDWQLDEEARVVLRLLAQGNHIADIARQLQVAPRHVYWVRDKLRQRFGALNNEQMISRAAAEGYIFP